MMSRVDDNVAIIGDWIPFPQNDEEGRLGGSKEMSTCDGQDDDGLCSFSDYQSKSLVERMAARSGFNAPRLNTEGMRPNDVLNSDSRSSPLLMISPGFSPTSLLDSPVFLSNSLAQPSPTTGKFPLFPTNGSTQSILTETNPCRGYLSKDIGSTSFAFKPSAETFSINGSNGNEPPMFSQQSLSFPRIENSTQSENSISLQPNNHNSSEPSKMQPPRMFESVPEQLEEEGDYKSNGDSEDGYNWRKYGQKQVKGSEFPRSYYKCTYTDCVAKKKVERSHEGHITEIIYKGAHNHPKPTPNRKTDNSDPSAAAGEAAVWKQDNFEVTSSPSEGINFGSSLQSLPGFDGVGGEAVDASSTFSSEEVEGDPATNGSVSLAYDAEGDESESKRRKIDVYPANMRAIREPRVVVQTTSEVDILDDGYRWRKYGQKVVKGNPNPRSYYKCTSPGCSVRKHVERASHDLKSVITTYEGKHNHDVPAARNTNHSGSSQPVHAHYPPDHSLSNNVMPRFNGSRPLAHFGLPGPPLHLGHGVSFGMGGTNLANFGLAGLGPVQGKMPMPMQHPFVAQQRQFSDMMQNGDARPASEAGLNNSASLYQQLMSRLPPLGP